MGRQLRDLRFTFDSRETHVSVASQNLSRIGEMISGSRDTRQIVVVTDERVGALFGKDVDAVLAAAGFDSFEHRVVPGETSKSLAALEALYGHLAKRDVGQDVLLLALGGGVISDLTGFAAATWMRGVDFANCPTTLEAAIDACLGGKTAINIPGGKNLVGAFHQPVFVAIDPICFRSLDLRDIRAGLAESVKHALLDSESFLAWHEERMDSILPLDSIVIEELIVRNLTFKAEIVARDVHDRNGGRAILNLGHTLGHAIEECCEFSLRHGECVGLGLLAAARMSARVCGLAPSVVFRIEQLLSRIGLPTRLPMPLAYDELLEVMRRDKKVAQKKLRFVLLEDIGRPVLRNDVPEQFIHESYEALLP